MHLELSVLLFFISLTQVLRIWQNSVEAERKTKLPSRRIEDELDAKRAIRAICKEW